MLFLIFLLAGVSLYAQTPVAPRLNEDTCFTFYIANDLGRNGYYFQQPVADIMGTFAEQIDIEFVAALGDVHHFDGVASTADPLWLTNYEHIYSHPELMIPWYPVLGNHEYRGNTRAVLDYSDISRRWVMPARYYSKEFNVNGDEQMLLVWIDTAPLISKYRNDTTQYPDASRQDADAQLRWLKHTLASSSAKWKIVMGHHPLYADTDKSDKERLDLQHHLLPLLDRYKVDAYICGHIHSFQHIRHNDSGIDYIVNGSGSLGRKVKPIPGTLFCASAAGFTIASASDHALTFYYIDHQGNILYTFSRSK